MNKYNLHLLIISIFLIPLSIYLVYPGIIYGDTYNQYYQALTNNYEDWHPPILSHIWRIFLITTGTKYSLYAILIIINSLSLVLLLSNLKKRYVALLYLILYFSPLFFSYFGWVYKDFFLATLILLISGLLPIYLKHKNIIFRIILILLLIFTSLFRANAAFITAPIIMYLAFSNWNKKIICYSVLLSILLVLVQSPINHTILKAHKNYPIISLKIFDISGISHFSKINYFPIGLSDNEKDMVLGKCYSSELWDNYAGWGKCSFLLNKLNSGNNNNIKTVNELLTKQWIASIKKHPYYYIKHRISHFIIFLTNHNSYGYGLDLGFYDASKDNEITYEPKSQKFESTYKKIFLNKNSLFSYTLSGLPWLLVLIILFIKTFKKNFDFNSQHYKLINCLCFSGIFYIGMYLFIGVASDLRYLLPSQYLGIAAIIYFYTYKIKDIKK